MRLSNYKPTKRACETAMNFLIHHTPDEARRWVAECAAVMLVDRTGSGQSYNATELNDNATMALIFFVAVFGGRYDGR